MLLAKVFGVERVLTATKVAKTTATEIILSTETIDTNILNDSYWLETHLT